MVASQHRCSLSGEISDARWWEKEKGSLLYRNILTLISIHRLLRLCGLLIIVESVHDGTAGPM